MSTNIDWARVKALFAQAIDLPQIERDAWIRAHCEDDPEALQELHSLLAAHEQSHSAFLSEAAQRLAPMVANRLADDEPSHLPGTRIGPYRLLRAIGTGGMGRVYLAERADGQFRQHVALKLIRSEFSSPELQRRFVRERDTLARLVHPNIATLHDGGIADDGSPYFTMEFVDGESITHWCDSHRSTLRARLELVVKVCDAVQYAHRNLVVHRDIKPSNILVTEAGEPKLLDFGIAKPIAGDIDEAALTGSQMRPMTREYAAPEQVAGEPITTATDIYALGVLLYRLLSGCMPYRRAALGQIAWMRAILEEHPEPLDRAVSRTAGQADDATSEVHSAATIATARSTSPRALTQALRGDLDRIAQRALAKLPDARYTTASAMADDVRAYLDGRALSGGTRTYRLRKFVRRHWLPLGAAAAVLLAVVGGAALVAADARKIEREARTTAAVKTFLLDLFRNANPTVAQGKPMSLRDVVDRGVTRLDSIAPEQIELKAELQNTLGTIYYQLGLRKEAATLHEQAYEAIKANPQDALLAVTARRYQATDVSALGDNVRAQALADEALQRARTLDAEHAIELARALDTAMWVAGKRRDPPRIASLSEEASRLAKQHPDDSEIVYLAMTQQAAAAKSHGDHAASADLYARASDAALRSFGPDTQEAINSQYLYANELIALGHFDNAQAPLKAALDASKRVFGETHVRSLRTEQLLGVVENESGHIAEAAQHFADLLALSEKANPRDEAVLSEVRLNYAESIIDLGQLDRAEPLLAQTHSFLQQHGGGEPAELEETLSTIGRVQMLRGELEPAAVSAHEAIAVMATTHSDDDSIALALLSEVDLRRGDIEGAIVAGRDARDHAAKVDGERSYASAHAHTCYGSALARKGDEAAAEHELRAALRTYADLVPSGEPHPQSSDARLALGTLLAAHDGSRDEGMQLLQQAAATRSHYYGAEDPRTREANEALRKLYGPARL